MKFLQGFFLIEIMRIVVQEKQFSVEYFIYNKAFTFKFKKVIIF